MAKNIVVCCDGTANQFAVDKTNVIKLYSTLVDDPERQVISYHPGIGTMEAPGALTNIGRKTTRVMGMAIGWGLERDIRDAYVFLMQNYEPNDRVFLFGFSRGAYTVRAVASVLRMYGLIRRGHEPMVPYAIRMLTSVSTNEKERARDERIGAAFRLSFQFKDTFCPVECKPWFVGVWDTVSTVGWITNPLKLPFIADNSDIEYGRHAVSIDEHRAFFRTNLWRPSGKGPHGPKDAKQVWFAGVHCDVGGGYSEENSRLSRIALEWMLAEARNKKLLIDEAKAERVLGRPIGSPIPPEDAQAEPQQSLKGAWRIAEFIPKRHYDWKAQKTGWRMNRFRSRTIPPGSLIHESVLLRSEEYRKRLPEDAVFEKTPPFETGSAA